jgi:hypothetical protein
MMPLVMMYLMLLVLLLVVMYPSLIFVLVLKWILVNVVDVSDQSLVKASEWLVVN